MSAVAVDMKNTMWFGEMFEYWHRTAPCLALSRPVLLCLKLFAKVKLPCMSDLDRDSHGRPDDASNNHNHL